MITFLGKQEYWENYEMKKKIMFVGFIFLLLFSINSCGKIEKYSVFYVHNNSSYVITNFYTQSIGEKQAIETIQPGKTGAFVCVWEGKDIRDIDIFYTMNGEEYTSSKRIRNGGSVNVKIFNDHFEW